MTLNQEIAHYYDVPYEEGALVVRVGKDGPAQQSGLSAGDVITAVDDVALKGWDELQHYIQKQAVGSTVRLTVKRGQKETRIDVRLMEAPSPQSQVSATQAFSNP